MVQKIMAMTAMKAHGYHNNSNVDASNALPDYNDSSSTSKSGRFDADLHGNVNILLGGWVTIAPADAKQHGLASKRYWINSADASSRQIDFISEQATLISQYIS